MWQGAQRHKAPEAGGSVASALLLFAYQLLASLFACVLPSSWAVAFPSAARSKKERITLQKGSQHPTCFLPDGAAERSAAPRLMMRTDACAHPRGPAGRPPHVRGVAAALAAARARARAH